MVLYGDKSLLLDAVKNGASLRVKSEQTQIIESHDIKNVYWETSDRSVICGQTFATYSKLTFSQVDENKGRWQYHVICTNGTDYTITVSVGNENGTTTSTTKQEFSWFFKTNTHKITVSSSQEYQKNLKDAFENGNSFLALEGLSSMFLSTTYMYSNNLNTIFYGQTVDNVRFSVTGSNNIESIFDIKAIKHNGRNVIAPWPIEGRWKSGLYQAGLRDVHWYADDNWEKIYVNDDTGQTVFGSLDSLFNAALTGKAIRFICSFSDGQISQTASYMKISSGKITIEHTEIMSFLSYK